jgi:hypothetical protein
MSFVGVGCTLQDSRSVIKQDMTCILIYHLATSGMTESERGPHVAIVLIHLNDDDLLIDHNID